MQTVDYRKGLPAMGVCFLFWGFQPLYWFMCTNLCGQIDTFFLMACRIIWAAVCCLCILKVQGKLPQLWAVFRDRQVLKREIPASVLLFGDWLVYLWAVQNGRVLECSLGYYIQPLVVFALGAVIFKEKMSWRHFIIIAIVVVGIVLSTSGFGGVPYVTIALALMSIVLIEYAGVRARGGAGFLKSLAAPTPIMTPMNILEIAIRPTSLCMRLFGNVLGAFVIMELIKLVVPVFVPAIFSLYFDLFDGLIQTYVFVFLTSLFMKESIGGEE